MTVRRELTTGFLAALVSILIIGGSFAISFSENPIEIAQIATSTLEATITSSPKVITPTSKPGELTLTPSSTPSQPTSTHSGVPTSCQFPSGWIGIVINQGDTLESLAQTYRTTPEILMEGNCLLIEGVSPGSMLYVPKPVESLTPTVTFTKRPTTTRCPGPPSGWVLYTIQSGDTLYSLSQAYGVTVSELQAANCMGYSTIIRVSEEIWVPNVPTTTPQFTSTPTPSPTPGATISPTGQFTPTATSTSTSTGSPTPTASNTPTPTATSTATATPTSTPTSTNTATPEPTATQN